MRRSKTRHRRPGRPRLALAALIVLAGAGLVAFMASPWPSALLVRWAFDLGGVLADRALAAHVPATVRSDTGLRYAADPDALLDIHRPTGIAQDARLPVIVWVHGGGFVAGSRTQVGNYARILAGDGHAVVAVDYALGPGTHYPVPVHQVNRALAYLVAEADRLQLDTTRVVLAGDSAGAQIAAQVAALITSPAYARAMAIEPALDRAHLVGTVLFCGPYDALLMKLGEADHWLVRTMLWAYLGDRLPSAEAIAQLSITRHLTPDFPPSFISVGNDDPLAPQSHALAEALDRHGVRVERLFFAQDHMPSLPHEYQFDLSRAEAREALTRVKAFLARVFDARGGPYAGATLEPLR